jgi:hypothetical protein
MRFFFEHFRGSSGISLCFIFLSKQRKQDRKMYDRKMVTPEAVSARETREKTRKDAMVI